ncbi:MAG: GGDEF domain-containing protein [Candidatus Omnitrophica bacterium]|nr:GGDEF domain-containing protein [Candidatus Omnitrophota bacterium]
MMIQFSRKYLSCLVFGLLSLVFGLASAEAGIKLKVSASNPSALQEQTVPVKSYLPRGIRPENVINAAGLDISYDVKKGQCYVSKDVVLPAKGTAVFQVEIEDIWLIPEDDLEKQRNYAHKLGDQLNNSEYAETGRQLVEEIEESVTAILTRQEENLIEKVSPIEHIGAYEQNKETLGKIKENVNILENMITALLKAGGSGSGAAGKTVAGGKSLLDRRVKVPGTSPKSSPAGLVESQEETDENTSDAIVRSVGGVRVGSCISQEAVRYANTQNISLESPENITLTIGVENPSLIESQTLPVRYYLSEEIKSSDVLNAGGLDVGFDFEKSVYYVYKDNVVLEPAEKKKFQVVLRNKWVMDKYYLLTLKAHADSVAAALSRETSPGSSGQNRGMAAEKNEGIQAMIDELLRVKSASELTTEFVAAFRNDQEKLKKVEQEVAALEEMVVTAGVVDVMTDDTKEKLCEDERDRKNIAASKGAEAIKEFKAVASTIFQGKSPGIATVWEVICGVVIFLGFLSSTFYYMQVKEQKSAMLDILTGAFSRGYITERFREELKIAQNTSTKCSLLVMDIDKFKSINDTYGHATGDTIIKEFVIALRKGVRATDMVGRFGGDEFLVVLPTSDKERAFKIADGIVKIVARHAFKSKNQLFNVTTSIGVATYPDDSGTAEDMFVKADGALYQIKRKGGNGVSAA